MPRPPDSSLALAHAGVFEPSGPPPQTRLQELTEGTAAAGLLQDTARQEAAIGRPLGDPALRKSSVDAFFHRCGGTSHLQMQDLARTGSGGADGGKAALPGNANAQLIGGKWRYVARPTEGEQLFTDFYGRCDSKHCDYYGRTYHYLPQ